MDLVINLSLSVLITMNSINIYYLRSLMDFYQDFGSKAQTNQFKFDDFCIPILGFSPRNNNKKYQKHLRNFQEFHLIIFSKSVFIFFTKSLARNHNNNLNDRLPLISKYYIRFDEINFCLLNLNDLL